MALTRAVTLTTGWEECVLKMTAQQCLGWSGLIMSHGKDVPGSDCYTMSLFEHKIKTASRVEDCHGEVSYFNPI